ncbi:hypothetical protein VaNZ11_000051 [Volvox africanus]|uniref:DUF3445 domain-containing protein n=1 Tax=Volvox africanus TaxID=51714 RepID=A0ABQ5RL64_9CHLO|nr:hypothetical protein VaNZ11_000051 [Volvox africanus]
MWSLNPCTQPRYSRSCSYTRLKKLSRRHVLVSACPFKGILNSKSLEDLPFRGFPPGTPYKLLLGLQEPKDPWLDVEEDCELLLDQLKQRATHILDRREAVIQLKDEPLAQEASWELLHELLHELPRRYPNRFAVNGSMIVNLLTGESFETAAPGTDPLEVAGRITQEDFCLLAPAGGGGPYRLLGGVVCFPSHWSVLEKLGMDLPTIHESVPRWRSDVAQLAERFMSRLSAGRPFVRWNWTLSATAELHLSKFYSPPPAPNTTSSEDVTAIDKLQLRLERQHFHKHDCYGTTYMPLEFQVLPRPRAGQIPKV